jgi:hypothetical protein
MSLDTQETTAPKKSSFFSLDTWAVLIAFVLALAVKFDVFKNVPW